MDHQQVVRARVDDRGARSPPDRVARAASTGWRRRPGRDVHLETRVDPSIIGGVVARIGSTVYDGSVTTQLEKMKQALIERPVDGSSVR